MTTTADRSDDPIDGIGPLGTPESCPASLDELLGDDAD